MSAVIKSVQPNSPAAKTIIKSGDVLRKINCNPIDDILDYEYYSYDTSLMLDLLSTEGKVKLVSLRKQEGENLGLEFENPLLDEEKHCANKCIFCFIDQLPKGMRESLYYKDDDVRLSFLYGNYVTLTNLSKLDIERIIKLRISPINVSVHTHNPKLRSFMLGGEKGGKGIDNLKALAEAGIRLNCQIVCCPGINDGWRLSRTIEGLMRLGSCINSVSIVPVGLTKHREGLAELRSFDRILARKTIRRVEQYGKRCLKKRGSSVFFCADELYILAGLKIPESGFYEDYPQLENGVGMMRLFITEFEIALDRQRSYNSEQSTPDKVSIVTGVHAKKYLTNLLKTAKAKYDKIDYGVLAVRNEFFGESVTVSGLITGKDIINQLKDKKLGAKLLIPRNMLRAGEEIFLDDITVSELSAELGVPVRVVETDGADLLHAILESQEK